MCFNGSDIDRQIVGDHLIGMTVDDRIEHLSFALGQPRNAAGCIYRLGMPVRVHGWRGDDFPFVVVLGDGKLMSTNHLKNVTGPARRKGIRTEEGGGS